MAGIKTIEEIAGEFFTPMNGYVNLHQEEAKGRLKSQILEGYQDGFNQDEIFQLAIEAYQEVSENMQCGIP